MSLSHELKPASYADWVIFQPLHYLERIGHSGLLVSYIRPTVTYTYEYLCTTTTVQYVTP